RQLRSHMTNAERRLWSRLRGKQLLGIQFYRQKPLGNFIVDFYAPQARLVIEVDGGQHFEPDSMAADAERTALLTAMNLRVLRFTNAEVLAATDTVVEHILEVMRVLMNASPRAVAGCSTHTNLPLAGARRPLFQRGRWSSRR